MRGGNKKTRSEAGTGCNHQWMALLSFNKRFGRDDQTISAFTAVLNAANLFTKDE
jgi:hypothetical protein